MSSFLFLSFPANRLSFFLPLGLLVGMILTSIRPLTAQSTKQALSFSDLRQWRKNAVSLSDDGAWYTKTYRLYNAPEAEEDTTSPPPFEAYYQADNQTDVLYICSAADGIQYRVPDGRRPIFSSASDWIAYQIKPDSDNKGK
ncbi:MAG: hypothetical protein AAF399_11900, partial [Bacteroidota bacterium]